jgi:sortase B
MSRAADHSQSQNGLTKWTVIYRAALVVFIAALLALGVLIYRYWAQQQAYNELESYVEVSDTNDIALADLTADWDALRAINPDIVGWIYVPNSPINYPIVQSTDNTKYLDTAFDGSNGWFSSAGTIFLDAKNNAQFQDRDSLIYGHHMRDGSMFAAITGWETNEEFNAHRDVYILTPNGNYYAKTYALVKTNGSDTSITQTQFNTAVDYVNYVQSILDRSIVTQEGNVYESYQIRQSIVLSTCEYTQNDGRDVLYATVIETTAKDDPYLDYDPSASTGLEDGQSLTFGVSE